jgi:hypothetical protein
VIKYSAIGPLYSMQNVTVDADGTITQAFHYSVFEDASGVDFLYPFMTMFNQP